MYLKINLIIAIFVGSILFSGCSKTVEEYNKPALYWYGKIIKSISNGDLEQADSYYSSLQGEHISSPLLPEATMILAMAHMHYEEYLLSEHFLDEYVKRYATENEKEFADFLKIKAMYKALPNPRRDQVLISNAIIEAQRYKRDYPSSMYIPIVDTILTRLKMAEAVLNESIAALYDRIDKPKSAQYYRDMKPQEWIDFENINRANSPWYRSSFEGDGTDSWYDIMITDTQSVVSRNTVNNDLDEEDTQTEQTIEEVQNKLEAKKTKTSTKTEDLSSEQLPLD